jgi:hypothetical protein
MVTECTPYYFSGMRCQMFPSRNVKTELWIVNGWQSYNSWNDTPGFGSSTYFRPNENLQLVGNLYWGKDTRGASTSRFHHDNSIVYRYLQKAGASGVSQAALSVNAHYGFQSGGEVKAGDSYIAGIAVANRIWFDKNRYGLTLRGDAITNPGLHLAFSPSPVGENDFNDAIASGKDLNLFQATATFDIMPNDFVTFRLEYNFRSANVPYFPGHGGTTSPDGWVDSSTDGWRPDLKKTENRVIFAANFRL